MTVMEEKPGMFRTPLQAVATLLGLVALMLFAFSALTADFPLALFWLLGAVLIFRGLSMGECD